MPPQLSYSVFVALFLSIPRISGHVHRKLAPTKLHTLRDVSPQDTSFTSSESGASRYQLVDEWKGAGFFDGFTFFSDSDPTHGMVNYLDTNTAIHTGLAYVQNDGVVVMKVDNSTDLPNGSPRNSIRISSKKSYDGGLFIFDVLNAPYGCGVWPALWTVGPNWPNGGEIDIFEGVHLGPTNQMTLHAQVGCATDISSTAPSAFRTASSASTVGTTDCGPSPTNGGCYFIDKSTASYGEALNSSGGAVIAMEWTAYGVKIWNFPRGHVPRDITLQTPIPALWPQTYLKAGWASTSCPTTKYFKQHSITIDTALCGDWAGATYSGAGCPGTCAEHIMTGANFASAVWKINSVSIYK